jgi:ribonuclease BN (tRNA processing enzyme)
LPARKPFVGVFLFLGETLTGSVKVTVLGAGDAFASGGRRQSAYLVQAGSRTFLMDAGPTLLGAMKEVSAPTADVDFVLLSHMHGDHFGGLVFLFLEYLFERPRSRELVIAGPPGAEKRVMDLFRASYSEISSKPLTFPVRFEVLEAGAAVDLCGVRVLPFAVPHQKSEPSLGYRVTVDGKTILYSGDCGWTDDLVRQSVGADLFICECTYFETAVDFHINYPELERNEPRLRGPRIVLTHLGREVLEKMDRVRVECAFDGMVIDL